ncbi:MAG: DUF1460 domain-containing protein, partial [Muribaculaceae bacterium]|nr:DUF1460 domain-containing protein [Muribaculaceae bacterium]
LCAALRSAFSAAAAPCGRFNSEASDTLRINQLLVKGDGIRASGDRIVALARAFTGTPYVGGTLEGDGECLTVNFDGVDCTTFVETVLALNSTAADRRLSWRGFLGSLESIRYRGGVLDDYASRLHYIADWALDNIHRGNLTEVTSLMPRTAEVTRSLDFMSTHADSYPALADPDQLRRIRDVERNFRNHRWNYVRSADVAKADFARCFRPGDIVAMVTRTKGLDVTHMGIVDVDSDGTVRLIHASSAAGKVVVDSLPLADYLRRNTSTLGVRVFRVAR